MVQERLGDITSERYDRKMKPLKFLNELTRIFVECTVNQLCDHGSWNHQFVTSFANQRFEIGLASLVRKAAASQSEQKTGGACVQAETLASQLAPRERIP